ncbi:hypothetical protein EDB85DRAFT_2276715 [Lactarius pseudohatsudake]|nr:hypothetical protein EDB85DRAFT_2276715 [Lactarius pseudohatsudake]
MGSRKRATENNTFWNESERGVFCRRSREPVRGREKARGACEAQESRILVFGVFGVRSCPNAMARYDDEVVEARRWRLRRQCLYDSMKQRDILWYREQMLSKTENSQVSFFACPATGQVSWDPPGGNFVIPHSENGQLWEISDESRGGIPYNHHTKSGETVWEKPYGFVIPLTVLQSPPPHAAGQPRPVVHHPLSYKKEVRPVQAPGRLQSSASGPIAPTKKSPNAPPMRRNLTTDPNFSIPSRLAPALPPIPGSEASTPPTPTHSHRSFIPSRSPPQSLGVAVERLTRTPPQSPDTPSSVSKVSSKSGYVSASESTRVKPKLKIEAPAKNGPPTAPVRPVPSTPTKGPTVAGKEIGRPVLNMNATLQLSLVRARAARTPIFVDAPPLPTPARIVKTLSTGAHPILWYFAAHRTGFIFRRKVPVGQMMVWQPSPLPTPLLNLSRPLHMDAVLVFRDVQRLMGDSEKGATAGSNTPRLEEARRLLGEGLANGELRDEVYCQVMKQLTNNPNAILSRTFTRFSRNTRGRPGPVDVLAKHCLKRLAAIAKKGPRGKPPSLAEIETASEVITGRSVQPIDVRRATRCRVPFTGAHIPDAEGANCAPVPRRRRPRTRRDKVRVSFAYQMRLDRGSYTLEGVDDPHVPTSLFKLWLRELVDPLVPSEMYNDCIAFAGDAEACCAAVERLPTANRRVVLFVIGFLQLFLDERVLAATKMTSANLALVMAPNLLRCGSDSMTIVFNDAQYEQAFVHNLLLHLNCGEIDAQYVPQHGLGAVPSAALRASKSRNRRARS